MTRSSPNAVADVETVAALARAAAAIARLDGASAGHPLTPALLHRARLDAVRRMAAVDGYLIDPWHLAALVEGLRPRRFDGARNLAEAGGVFEAGRAALALHRWLVAPDFDEEGEVRAATAALREGPSTGVALLDAAAGAWRWLDRGGARPPLRAALVRHWVKTGTIRAPLPLTGAAALRADAEPHAGGWTAAFLDALAGEAADTQQTLLDLERAWFAARRAVTGRRRHSRAPGAVDLLAAAPLLSATTLAAALGVSIKSALDILDALVRDDVAVEVTGRAARRLFGLRGLAPLAAAVRPPRRPEPGRGRGWPRAVPVEVELTTPPPMAPLTPVERRAFDYSDLTGAMDELDAALRRARRALDAIARGEPDAAGAGGPTCPPEQWDDDEAPGP
nr:hypothetical protein [Roseicella aerolata]